MTAGKSRFILNPDGTILAVIPPEADGMTWPVRCKCGRIYDLGTVEVTQRYADCSVWKTPCCGRQVDDRPWKGDYTRIERDE